MNFTFTEEQEALRDTVRRFCADKSPSSEVRRLMETTEGYDPAVWKQLSAELGLTGLHIPEEYGGQGFGFVELAVVLEETGQWLLCAPYLSTVCLAANAILNAGAEEQRKELLPSIASGETIATLALADNGRWDLSGITMEARPDPAGYVLDGTKRYVIDGHTADLIVVAARRPGTEGEDGVSLYVVRGDADGIERTPLELLDPTRKQAELRFDGVKAQSLGEPGDVEAVHKTLRQAEVCLAAESTGGAQRCLDMAVGYAKERVQFGRPIGQFQAVKHKCAEMLLDVESARSASYYATWAAAEDSDELPVAASLAKAYCTEAYFRCARENIQVHGGIGFTWEHDAHLYYRRAKSSELYLGDPTYHRELIAQRLGI